MDACRDCSEDDHDAEISQETRSRHDPQREPGRARRMNARRTDADIARQMERRGARELQARQDQQDRVRRQIYRSALGDHSTGDPTERRAHPDPTDVALRALDVEPLVDDRPESRDQDGARRA